MNNATSSYLQFLLICDSFEKPIFWAYEAQLSATSPDGVIQIRTDLRFLVSKSGDAELFHLGQLKPSNLFHNSTSTTIPLNSPWHDSSE
jgi:hypothetical protein